MARKLSLDLETETLEQTEVKDSKLTQTAVKKNELNNTELNTPVPIESKLEKIEVKPSELNEPIPNLSPLTKAPPTIGHPENVVTIDGIDVEIKPTKYRYFRNKFATYYKYMKEIPMSEFLILGEGTFGQDQRSGDQVIFDFLCAVFDDPCFVQDHYDNMDPDLMEKILEIYSRVNHIKDKEDAAKNRQAQMTV